MVISFFNFAFSSMIFFNSSSTLLLLSCSCSSNIWRYLIIFSWSAVGSFILLFYLVRVSIRYLSVKDDSFFLYSPSSIVSRSTYATHCFSTILFSCCKQAISSLRLLIVEWTSEVLSFEVESNFMMFSLFLRDVSLSIYY